MTPVWRAFANMSRAAARDPLWALACVVFGPVRGGFYLAKCLLMGLIVALVLLFAVSFAVEAAGQKGAWPHRAGNIAAGLVALAVFWRFASRPLIDHFGDMASDTHGSASHPKIVTALKQFVTYNFEQIVRRPQISFMPFV